MFPFSKRLSDSASAVLLEEVFRVYYGSGEYKTRTLEFIQHITGNATISKEALNSLVGQYTYGYWELGIKWPLLEGVDVSTNGSIAIRDAFTDKLWEIMDLERTKLFHENMR